MRAVLAALVALALAVSSYASANLDLEVHKQEYDWAEPRPNVDNWMHFFHEQLEEAEEARRSGKGFELLFFGDSITECWRGTGIGKPSPGNCAGTPDVYDRHWRQHYNSQVFAVGADKTCHLMWRLLHGTSPQGLHTKAAVLLIGTNDLGYAAEKGPEAILAVVNSTIQHIKAIGSFIMDAEPGLQLIVQGILPRGDWAFEPPKKFAQPSKYTKAIDLINKQVEAWAGTLDRAHYVYCGDSYLDGNGNIIGDLMPDALHPDAAGMELMAQCLEPWVGKFIPQGHPQQQQQPQQQRHSAPRPVQWLAWPYAIVPSHGWYNAESASSAGESALASAELAATAALSSAGSALSRAVTWAQDTLSSLWDRACAAAAQAMHAGYL